ncbi:hypothetical protein K469DRAFT_576605, partial [Zopfia rhizophila CBS 207.26]
TLDLLLTNFSNFRCIKLNLNSSLLSNNPFSNPYLIDYKLLKVNMFSLGIIIYIIIISYYPFYNSFVL